MKIPHLRLVVNEPDKLAGFLSELTALSERFGIAIADGAQLYEIEQDDRLFSYQANDESQIVRA